MIFYNRQEAGKKLAHALQEYADRPNAIVIALPRGGVIVGDEVATQLHLPLDILCPRKIGAPMNPEFAIGAITETGEGMISEECIRELKISEEELKVIIEKEKQEAKWRVDNFRKGRVFLQLEGKTVIVVDDGIATGFTMCAALKSIKAEKAAEIIMAVPVAPPETLLKFKGNTDKIVCLSTPANFYAVGQFYEIFDQVEDEEVVAILEKHVSRNFTKK